MALALASFFVPNFAFNSLNFFCLLCRLPPLCLHQRISSDVIDMLTQQQQQQGEAAVQLPFSEMVLTGE